MVWCVTLMLRYSSQDQNVIETRTATKYKAIVLFQCKVSRPKTMKNAATITQPLIVYFVFRLALNVLRGSRFLDPTLNPRPFFPLTLRSFLIATKPMSFVKACLPSLGRRYSGTCFR